MHNPMTNPQTDCPVQTPYIEPAISTDQKQSLQHSDTCNGTLMNNHNTSRIIKREYQSKRGSEIQKQEFDSEKGTQYLDSTSDTIS